MGKNGSILFLVYFGKLNSFKLSQNANYALILKRNIKTSIYMFEEKILKVKLSVIINYIFLFI